MNIVFEYKPTDEYMDYAFHLEIDIVQRLSIQILLHLLGPGREFGSVTRDDGVGTTEPFNGSTMTKNNSPDGEEPVETTVTTPTTLITKEPGDSKLLVK